MSANARANFFAPRTKRKHPAASADDNDNDVGDAGKKVKNGSASSSSSHTATATTATTAHTAVSKVPFSSVDSLPGSDEWRETECGTLLYLYPRQQDSQNTSADATKIAGFDIDGTVIKTKSGKKFPINDLEDWKLWSTPHVKATLSKLHSDGYRIVFFTNQGGISNGKGNKEHWKQKILNVIEKLGLTGRITVLASLIKGGNDFRKPHVGMWRFLGERLSSPGVFPDAASSFYVGDAAGRPKRGTAQKDFSASDYKFALNVGGLTFKTPEQTFLGSTKRGDAASLDMSTMGFQPKRHWARYVDRPRDARDNAAFDDLVLSCAGKKEVIVIVGSPASGKSTFAGRLIREIAARKHGAAVEYVRVNQDTLRTQAKCIDAAKRALRNGKSAIIDNTNSNVKTRKEYVDVAAEFDSPCRCLWIATNKEESFHLNAFRGAAGNADGERRVVSDVVIHTYYKNMVDPKESEGFAEVRKMNFVPGPFDSDERQASFYRFAM